MLVSRQCSTSARLSPHAEHTSPSASSPNTLPTALAAEEIASRFAFPPRALIAPCEPVRCSCELPCACPRPSRHSSGLDLCAGIWVSRDAGHLFLLYSPSSCPASPASFLLLAPAPQHPFTPVDYARRCQTLQQKYYQKRGDITHLCFILAITRLARGTRNREM